MKTRLELRAEIDLLNKDELEDALHKHSAWERQAAFGLKHMDIPKMTGTPNGGALALGGDQPDQQPVGPRSGWVWGVKRISVDGLSTSGTPDVVKLYKGARFVCFISASPGYVTFGKGQLVLRDQDYLRITGTGLAATGQVEVYGEADNVPAVMAWKILS
jgi:hypothetical protein